MIMRMAITDRTGDDTSPMTLAIEQTEWDRLPPILTLVCAIGQNGWRYIGQVASHSDDRHYVIQVWTASNKLLDNVRQYGVAR